MPTKSKEIDAYLNRVEDPAAKKALTALRARLHKLIPEATETISYRMPTLVKDGKTVIAFAWFGKHCGLYPYSSNVIPQLEKELKAYKTTKGGVSFAPEKPLPEKVLKEIVKLRLKELGREAPKKSGITDRVSDAKVKEATGRTWDAWFRHLDKQGGKAQDHKALVKTIATEVDSTWWQQSISVAYEQSRGKRAVGQTKSTGYQVGVVRTLKLSEDEAWELVLDQSEKWLGAQVQFEVGQTWEVPKRRGAPGVRGTIKVVRPGTRVRMTWQQDGWPKPATLQITPVAKPTGVSFGVHMENLPSAEVREQMREHWAKVLENLS